MVSLNDVLLAYSNIPVDDPIAEIWGRGLQGGYEIIEYTGTLPITINADGNALIDYCIYGNTEQSGTPTPENPVDVVGCGVRTGNLFDEEYPNIIADTPRYKAIYVGDGEFTLSTTSPLYGQSAVLFFFAGNVSSGASTNSNGVWTEQNRTVTAINGYVTVAYRYYINTDPRDNDTMLNSGSTALPYEPYGYKLPMLSNSTVTNIYLGEVETTRRIKKLVLTGEERMDTYIYSSQRGVQVINVLNGIYRRAQGFCNISPVKNQPGTTNCVWIGSGGGDSTLYFVSILDTMGLETTNDFKSYLQQQYAAGTPVTVWYVLANEETGVVNEPLMKIGDYADTISMEQAGVNIPTFAGTTVIDYDGELKPSQMYVKYRR